MGRPGNVVGEVGSVDWGEALGVHQEEVGLLLGAIKPNSDEDTIILASAISGGEYSEITRRRCAY